MTKITAQKFHRKFEQDVRTGLVTKREKVIESVKYKVVPCLGCQKPLKMSYGQIVFWHRGCRTSGRYRMKRDLAGKL